MSAHKRAPLVAGVLMMSAALTGCWSSPTPQPSPSTSLSTLPTVAPAGAETVCGMDSASLEAATGFAVDRADGSLTASDGAPSGEWCEVTAVDASMVTGALASVRLYAASSPEGIHARAVLDRDPTLPLADMIYGDVDGWISGAVEPRPKRMTLGATSAVFFGDTVVEVVLSRADVGRVPAVDQLALTRQIAATYGLSDS